MLHLVVTILYNMATSSASGSPAAEAYMPVVRLRADVESLCSTKVVGTCLLERIQRSAAKMAASSVVVLELLAAAQTGPVFCSGA